VPDQMNARRSLSIDATAQGDRHRTMDICVEMEDIVALASVERPAALRRFPFHFGILAATLSIIGCSSERVRRRTDSGAPRYRQGNCSIRHDRMPCTRATSSSEQCSGMATLLSRLENSPDAKPKVARAAFDYEEIRGGRGNKEHQVVSIEADLTLLSTL